MAPDDRCSDPSCAACSSEPIRISIGVYPKPLLSLPALIFIILGLALAVGIATSGCGSVTAAVEATGGAPDQVDLPDAGGAAGAAAGAPGTGGMGGQALNGSGGATGGIGGAPSVPGSGGAAGDGGAAAALCGSGPALCKGVCADLTTSYYNCGSCGNQCGGGETCVNGNCTGGNSTMSCESLGWTPSGCVACAATKTGKACSECQVPGWFLKNDACLGGSGFLAVSDCSVCASY
jgi:hypothetical protein